jgi:hypothetical protein
MFCYYRSFIKNVPLQKGPSPVSKLTLLWACFILSVATSIMPTSFVLTFWHRNFYISILTHPVVKCE